MLELKSIRAVYSIYAPRLPSSQAVSFPKRILFQQVAKFLERLFKFQ